MNPTDWIQDELASLRARHLDRALRPMPAVGGVMELDGRRTLNFSSNDYLDLANHPDVKAAAGAALERYGAGATASRLVAGTLPIHEELEQRLARHKGYPAALLFGSGYLANAGAVTALAGRGDTIYADRLAHASLIDAAVLSRARLRRFRHNDPGHLADLLERDRGAPGRRLVITESVFSMDGDLAPLADLARVARDAGAMLLVDEAHATGVFGPGGRGCIRAAGLEERVDVAIGTLGKALGAYGGYAAGSEMMRAWFIQRARAFIYTTAPPPAVAGAVLGALDVLDRKPDMGQTLLARAARFRDRLREGDLDTMQSRSQIVPVLVGDNARALRIASRLRSHGILAVAIRPPTVPEGTARLRLSVTLAHSEEDLEEAAERVGEMMNDE